MIALTRFGFGGAPIGNLFSAVSDEDARGAIDAAWDAGTRFFDTAPHYGLGLSERRMGAALRERPRSSYVLSTKIGRLIVPSDDDRRDDPAFDEPTHLRRQWDFSAAGVRRSLEESLERLGLDSVDLVLIHDPVDFWRQAVEEAYPALAELRDQGVIKAVGVGMIYWQMLLRFVRETDVDTILCAGRYTLLDQSAAAELLPACLERGVGVLAAGVFNSGVLATHDPHGTYEYAPAPPEIIARAREIAAVCDRHGVTLPQAAMAFPFRHPAVVSAVIGARTAAEVTRNTRLAATPVPPDLWTDLKEEGLLDDPV